MSAIRIIVPGTETSDPILVTAGFEYLYLQTGKSKEQITIAQSQIVDLVQAIQRADHERRMQRKIAGGK